MQFKLVKTQKTAVTRHYLKVQLPNNDDVPVKNLISKNTMIWKVETLKTKL